MARLPPRRRRHHGSVGEPHPTLDRSLRNGTAVPQARTTTHRPGPPGGSPMADHFSGPRAIADPASDITDVFTFPSPERPGQLVLVMDVFPAAGVSALFSDALTHRFRLRTVTATNRATPGFAVDPDEYAVDITFDAP